MLARIGSGSLAAHQIAFQLFIFLALVLDSIAIAGQVMVGRALGRGRRGGRPRRRAPDDRLAVMVGALFSVILLALTDVLPHAFTSDDGVIDRAHAVWPLFALMQPSTARCSRSTGSSSAPATRASSCGACSAARC